MGRVFKIYDEALDGFVQAEWMVTGTIFFIGLGLSTLGMALTGQGWLIRGSLILGGVGAMLIAVRAMCEIKWS